jgi:hypothetical protein
MPVELIEGKGEKYDKAKYRDMLLEVAETVLGFDRTLYGDVSRKNRKWWHQLREQRQRHRYGGFNSSANPLTCLLIPLCGKVHEMQCRADRFSINIASPDYPIYTSQKLETTLVSNLQEPSKSP